MADTKTKQQRSENMSHIHGTDTSIEISVRKYLFRKGFRYRKNVNKLPGNPDMYLKKYNTAIFVNGCFWHHHNNCKYARIPKTNIDYWTKKIERNAVNDRRNIKKLRENGMHVITIWECRLKKDFNKEMNRVIRLLNTYANMEEQ